MIINPSKILSTCGVAVALVLAAQSFAGGKDHKHRDHHSWGKHHSSNVQVGPRPYFLIDDMDESWLKRKLQDRKSVV